MGYWDDNAKEAEVGSGGGEFPELEDDLYEAQVADISEPTVETIPEQYRKKGGPTERTRFYVSVDLYGDNVPDDCPPLRIYLTVPDGFRNNGVLNEKSKLYEMMTALGYDLSGRFKVDPREWQGQKVRVLVECPRDKDGVQTGWPKITEVKAVRKAKPAPKREPVAAAAGKRGGAPFGEDDEDD